MRNQSADRSEPRKIRVFTAFQLGCLTGLLVTCGPALLCSLSFNQLVRTIHRWVLSWDGPDAELSIGGLLGGTTLRVSLDMQEHLKMTEFVKTLDTVENSWWLTIPLITLALTLLVATSLATLSGLSAGLYNEIGRQRWLVSSPVRQTGLQYPGDSQDRSNEEH